MNNNYFKKIKNRYNNGFTLIELMIVIAIVLILSATSLVLFDPVEKQKEQRDALRVSNLSQIASQLELYYAVNKKYPQDLTTGTGGINENNVGINAKVSIKDPIEGCEVYYKVDSESTSYNLYAMKQSINFTVPKGQYLISIQDNSGISFGESCSIQSKSIPKVFKISGGTLPQTN